jgi:hypothetical protein
MPSTKPLDGLFWYVLDDEGAADWKPYPKLRGDFYLGWLGQNKNVVGAGLMRMAQGQVTHICTHGTPYFWLQPFEVLPLTSEAIRAQELPGADTMSLDFTLAGWVLRDHARPQVRQWPDASVTESDLQPLLIQAVNIIVRHFRSEGKPSPKPEQSGLLSRTELVLPPDPLEELLGLLKDKLGEGNVVSILTELVKHDINVLPSFRQSSFFESLPTNEEWPSAGQVARLVVSAVYHLAPRLGSRRLSGTLLLDTLRQRHPFDVTWGAGFLVNCFGMKDLVRLLFAALQKEQNEQVRGNVLDLVQELGYGVSVDLEFDALKHLTNLQNHKDLGAFGQVIDFHIAFVQEYIRQRDAAAGLDS